MLISGHCGQNFCDQKCIDIDNGGFACDCYHGYQLNRNGFTCSSKYIKNCLSILFFFIFFLSFANMNSFPVSVHGVFSRLPHRSS